MSTRVTTLLRLILPPPPQHNLRPAAFTHACALTGTVDERAFLDKLAVEDWIWIRLVKQLDEFSDSYQVTANVANVLLNPFRQMAAQLSAVAERERRGNLLSLLAAFQVRDGLGVRFNQNALPE